MSSLPSRVGVFATFTFCFTGCTDGRRAAPPGVIVVVVLVLVLAVHAGLECVNPGALVVLTVTMAELLVGRRSGGTRADQGL